MLKKTLLILLIMALLPTAVLADEWDTFSKKDEMTGEKRWFAVSPGTTSNNPMSFPYGDTEAWMVVGTDGSKEWAYMGFSNQPNIKNTKPKDGYSTFQTRVKFDDRIYYMYFSQEWGSRFLHFQDKHLAISHIKGNNKVLIELDWAGENNVYFEFSLDGSAEAIKKIREKTK